MRVHNILHNAIAQKVQSHCHLTATIVPAITITLLILVTPNTSSYLKGESHNKIRHQNHNQASKQLVTHSGITQYSDKTELLTTVQQEHSRSLQQQEESSSRRCLVNATDQTDPKYFYYGEQELTIGILVSNRLTHKLASNVFKVFAEEILGYVNISLVSMDDPTKGFDPDTQFSYISSCESSE